MKERQLLEPVDRLLTPLPINRFDWNSNGIMFWLIIGYGSHEGDKKGRMITVRGARGWKNLEFVCNQDEMVQVEVDHSGPLIGMSGGPWIPSDVCGINEANGVQSGIKDETNHFTCSPCLTVQNLEELNVL